MRRKRVYRHTLEGLLQEISQLHQKLESKETGDIVARIQEAMEREEEEDLELEGDDFIIDGSSGQVQVLEGRERREENKLHRLQESVGELGAEQQN